MNSTNCAYLNPVGVTDMKYIMLKAPRQLTMLYYHAVQTFDKKSRWIYAVTYTILILVWHLMNILRMKIMNEKCKKNDFSKLLLMVLGFQCSISVPIKGNRSLHQRILICLCLISALIKCSAFQGLIISNLNRPKRSHDINTLEELLATDVNLTALTVIPNLFKPNEDESNVNKIQKRLYQRQRVVNLMVDDYLKEVFKRANQAVLSTLIEIIFDNYC